MSKRAETSYYQEIVDELKMQMSSIFASKYPEKGLECFFKTNTGDDRNKATDFKKGLQDLIDEYPIQCECMIDYVSDVPPLLLDIFFVVTNGKEYQIGIIEVKAVRSVGLKECSQLIGYCIASKVELGILLNVDGDVSEPLYNLTPYDSYLTNIHHVMGDKDLFHKIGIMRWDSEVTKFKYCQRGNIRTIEELCDLIAKHFD